MNDNIQWWQLQVGMMVSLIGFPENPHKVIQSSYDSVGRLGSGKIQSVENPNVTYYFNLPQRKLKQDGWYLIQPDIQLEDLYDE